MRIKFVGAAAVAILASSLAVAQAQMPSQPQQPAPQTQPAETPPGATPPDMTPPGPVPDGTSTQQAQKAADHPKPHAMSACQKAIQASEKALEKSQASPDTIAQAWQHISNAKQEKGPACRDEAKQAQEML